MKTFLEKGEAFRYRCSNGHSVLYIRDVEEDQIDPYAPSAWGYLTTKLINKKQSTKPYGGHPIGGVLPFLIKLEKHNGIF